MPVHGRRPWPSGDGLGPERALLAAVILQAIRDARAGDDVAAAWLAGPGAAVADLFLGLHPDALARWPEEQGARVYHRAAARAAAADTRERALARKRESTRAARARQRWGGLIMVVSVRTHYRDPRGFVLELTMQDETGAALLPALGAALDTLLKAGCKPVDPFTEPTAAEVARNLARAQLAQTAPGAGPGGRKSGGSSRGSGPLFPEG